LAEEGADLRVSSGVGVRGRFWRRNLRAAMKVLGVEFWRLVF
jgi:hypothetical protein